MTALVFAPPLWHFYAFPLVVQWRAPYEALAFTSPMCSSGSWKTSPRQQVSQPTATPPEQYLPTGTRDYHPGELSQWQAYLDYLSAQADQDEYRSASNPARQN